MTWAGETDAVTGVGYPIVKGCALEVPPSGAGSATVTLTVPALASCAADTTAVSWVAETNVVGSGVPPHRRRPAESKPVPVAVMVVSEAPMMIAFGERLVRVGTGRFTEKASVFELPPPRLGVVTPTVRVPALDRVALGIVAWSWVALVNVVVRDVPLIVTTLPATKPVPVTVIGVVPAPTVTEVGLRLVSASTGLTTERFRLFEVPPPGPALLTVSGNSSGVVRRFAGMSTWSWVGVTATAAASWVPFQVAWVTVESTNPVPVMVTRVTGLPAGMLLGLRSVIVGTG
jgi:hypothetical protein